MFKEHNSISFFSAEQNTKNYWLPFVKATTEGVVLEPSAFSITFACLPSITATQEFVVPKSIPITAPLTFSDLQILI